MFNMCLIKTVKMFNDKYLTQKFLAENNLPFLKTYLPNNIREASKISKKLNFLLFLKVGTALLQEMFIKLKI